MLPCEYSALFLVCDARVIIHTGCNMFGMWRDVRRRVNNTLRLRIPWRICPPCLPVWLWYSVNGSVVVCRSRLYLSCVRYTGYCVDIWYLSYRRETSVTMSYRVRDIVKSHIMGFGMAGTLARPGDGGLSTTLRATTRVAESECPPLHWEIHHA
ncbi:hypothetical protein BC628DRAFT_136457 [Trametes gibbosa]|nr:hypothetical protein BC628DRAFT_136457 [Trametes gibbosa]